MASYRTAQYNNQPVAVQLSEPGNRPPLGLVRVAPFLPMHISVQRGVASALVSRFVLDAGEPVAIWRQESGGKVYHWLIPAVGTTDVTITYTADDVTEKVIDLDTGVAVVAPKTTTAKLPALKPAGIVIARCDRNYLDLTLDAIWENYGEGITPPTVQTRAAQAIYPYVRYGPNAQVPAPGVSGLSAWNFNPGDPVRVGNIYGGTLSVDNRPHIAKDNGPAAGAVDVENAGAGDTVTLTLNGAAQAALVQGTDWSTPATLKTAIDGQITAAGLDDFITSSVSGNIVTVQSSVVGITLSIATGDVGGTLLNYALSDGLGADYRLGKVFRVFPAYEEKFIETLTDTTLPLPLGQVINPSGLETVAGNATGGVPQQLLVRGNSTSDETPSGATARSKAGVVEILI